MSDSAALEFFRLAEALKKKIATNRLASWKPYPKQKEFMHCKSKIKVLFGANQCLGKDQEIYDPVADISRKVSEIDSDFHVYAWDGFKRIVASAKRPYKKCDDKTYRVKFSNGQEIVCGAGHQLLNPGGWISVQEILDGLVVSGVVHLPSTLAHDQSARVLDEANWLRRVVSSQYDYRFCRHSHDGQPRGLQVSDQDVQTSQNDVLGHTPAHYCCHEIGPLDDLEGKLECIRLCLEYGHHSSTNAPNPCEVHEVASLLKTSCSLSLPKIDLLLAAVQLVQEESFQPRSYSSSHLPSAASNGRCESSPCVQRQSRIHCNKYQQHGLELQAQSRIDHGSFGQSRPCDEATLVRYGSGLTRLHVVLSAFLSSNIISIDEISEDVNGEIWDFEVESTGNYFIGDILNHNSGKTTTVCAELTYHLTGVYPDDWKGVKYTRPVDIWIAGETNVRVRDTLQEKLFGRPGQMGTGTIPKSYIDEDSMIRKAGIPYAIDIARIRHHTDGIEDGLSTLQFFSYDMKREAFQGSTVDIIEFDEEPPDDINDECKMRVIAKSGRLFYTFTPLKGMTPLWNELNKNEDVAKFWLTWDDITHLKEEDKNALIKGMSEDQIRARKYGVATVGSSQIFQFQEEDYVCDDFEIPKWWPRLGGLDPGVNHPTGALAAAYDEEADTVYFYREYQVAGGSGAAEHAQMLRKWGIPFAVDRSAWQRDKAITITPASIYEECGLTLVNAGNVAKTTTPSIMEIRTRISEGRFFIFKSLVMLREQMKLYRTKEDGITIYKEKDDLIDPMRYVCMNIKSATMRKNDANSDIIMPREDGPFNSYSII